jgi:LCP family protein required for cell wall assembly
MASGKGASPVEKGLRLPALLRRMPLWLLFVLIAAAAALVAGLWATAGAGREDAPPNGQATMAAPSQSQVSGNGLTATPLPPPVTPPPCVAPDDWTTHVVEEGDTLYSLAELYRTDVEALMVVNCLQDEVIFVGQTLAVPGVVARRSNRQPSIPDHFTNVVLLGSDRRENSGTWRTDTIIVLSVDNDSDAVRLLSIPRDLWVDIPGHGEDRINTAEMWGELEQTGSGPELIKQTIYDSLGIPIQFYVRVDFDGFTRLIDAMGGVDIDVECPLPDIELTAGRHHMDGEDALLYARSRISTNDFDRNRRQRKLLMALWQQGLTADMIPRIPALWKAMAGTFETDLPLDEVVTLALKGLRVRPNTIFSESIGPWQVENWVTPGGADVLLPIEDEIEKLLADFYAPPDLEFLDRIARTRVEVLNGSAQPESGALVADSLRWLGVQVTDAGPAERQDYGQTQIIAYNTDVAIAELVARQLEMPRSTIQYQPDVPSSTDIRVIVGSDYDPCSFE